MVDGRPRSRSFGAVAEAYDEFRPGYPDDAVDRALEGAGPRVLDLGAGTGKLTRSLVARGLDVVAVEPDPEMLEVLEVLRSRLPAVLVGQALHWSRTIGTRSSTAYAPTCGRAPRPRRAPSASRCGPSSNTPGGTDPLPVR